VSSETFRSAFEAKQSSVDYDNRYYPFTEVHPLQPWYQRVKTLILGESTLEKSQRLELRNQIWNGLVPVSLNDLRTPSNIASGYSTPGLSNVGIGIKTVSGSNFLETIEASSSFHNIFNKIASIPSTPKLLPSNLVGGNNTWDDDIIEDHMLDQFFTL
jgi:hypothetical protein